jgi:hypothetical protein
MSLLKRIFGYFVVFIIVLTVTDSVVPILMLLVLCSIVEIIIYMEAEALKQSKIDSERYKIQISSDLKAQEIQVQEKFTSALRKEKFTISEQIVASTHTQFTNHRVSGKSTVAIAFDFDTLSICVSEISSSDAKVKIFPVSEILSIEVVEDGHTVSQSTTTGKTEEKISNANMLGRAVVGGVLLGGVGAIIGGATAKKTGSTAATTNTTTKDVVNSITLKLLLNNTSTPLLSIPFLSGQITKHSYEYTNVYSGIERCEALIKVLIARVTNAQRGL